MGLDLANKSGHPFHILLGAVELLKRPIFFDLILLDSCRVFQHSPPFDRSGMQNSVRHSLVYHAVAVFSDTGFRQKISYIQKPDPASVDQIFRFSAAVQFPGYHDFGKFQRDPLIGVVEMKCHLGAREPGFSAAAGKNNVFGFFTAERLHGLLPDRPLYRVGNIGFAAAVRTHDRSYAGITFGSGEIPRRIEFQHGLISK